MIAVVFALEFEATPFRTQIPGVEVWVLGVGGERSAQGLRRALATRGRPRRIVSAGLAGALDPQLRVGEVFGIASQAAEGSEADGLALLAGLSPARLVTVAAVAATPASKSDLRAATGADLCDMETAHLVEVCRVEGIPVSGIRAVSDTAGDNLPVPPGLLMDPQHGRPVAATRLLAYLAVRPAAWVAFFRMVKGASLARSRLAAELNAALGRELCC